MSGRSLTPQTYKKIALNYNLCRSGRCICGGGGGGGGVGGGGNNAKRYSHFVYWAETKQFHAHSDSLGGGRTKSETLTAVACYDEHVHGRGELHNQSHSPLFGITNNLAISKKIRKERCRVEQIFTKGVRHQVVNNTVESIVKREQLLGEGDLCKAVT